VHFAALQYIIYNSSNYLTTTIRGKMVAVSHLKGVIVPPIPVSKTLFAMKTAHDTVTN
jgi:hypothetical protein